MLRRHHPNVSAQTCVAGLLCTRAGSSPDCTCSLVCSGSTDSQGSAGSSDSTGAAVVLSVLPAISKLHHSPVSSTAEVRAFLVILASLSCRHASIDRCFDHPCQLPCLPLAPVSASCAAEPLPGLDHLWGLLRRQAEVRGAVRRGHRGSPPRAPGEQPAQAAAGPEAPGCAAGGDGQVHAAAHPRAGEPPWGARLLCPLPHPAPRCVGAVFLKAPRPPYSCHQCCFHPLLLRRVIQHWKAQAWRGLGRGAAGAAGSGAAGVARPGSLRSGCISGGLIAGTGYAAAFTPWPAAHRLIGGGGIVMLGVPLTGSQ
jgi:hypothetical protein